MGAGGDGVGFDLHTHVGRDQAAHLDHGAGRPDVAEDLAVGAADGFEVVLDVGDEEARATTSERWAPARSSAAATIPRIATVCA